MAEFKRLSDVEVVAEPTESANVLIEENGVIKRAPKTAVGGGSTGSNVPDMEIMWMDNGNSATIISGDLELVKTKYENGDFPEVILYASYSSGSFGHRGKYQCSIGNYSESLEFSALCIMWWSGDYGRVRMTPNGDGTLYVQTVTLEYQVHPS